jgi:hypothetical protein
MLGWYYMGVPRCIKKTVYLQYQCFLKKNHKYAASCTSDIMTTPSETEPPPERRQNGQHVFEMVKNIRVIFEKKNPDGTNRDRSTPPVASVPFKKQSIFFQYLPYWPDLEVLMPLMICTYRRMSLRVSLLS